MKPLLRLMLVVASMAFLPALVLAGPSAAATGGNKATVEQCKQSGLNGFRNTGQCVSSGAKGKPAPSASLELSNFAYTCFNFPCWGLVRWSGLQAPSFITLNVDGIEFAIVSASSTDMGLDLPCGQSQKNVVATGTTAAGTSITSNSVNAPC